MPTLEPRVPSARRARPRAAGALAALALALAGRATPVPADLEPPDVEGPVTLTEEAWRLHHDGFVFDGHNDLPWQLRVRAGGDLDALEVSEPRPELHTDLGRLRRGGVGAQFWSAYVPVESERPVTETLEQIDLIHRLVARHPDVLETAWCADDVERIVAAGRIASLIGVEGGHSIDGSLGVLRAFHDLGVRYMTLTHADSLAWADAATDAPRAGGLSAFGERVVAEMNALGMLVDVSHVSDETMRDVLAVTRAPIIASHSSARAVADHVRNVPDDLLRAIADDGGLVMINFASGYVTEEGAAAVADAFDARRRLRAEHEDDEAFEEAWAAWQQAHPIPRGTVLDVADHVEHVARVAGVEHVGIGSDYDGVTVLPVQLDDVSCYPYLTQALLDRGLRRDEIHAILGGNALRVLREAEAVARRLGAQDEVR